MKQQNPHSSNNVKWAPTYRCITQSRTYIGIYAYRQESLVIYCIIQQETSLSLSSAPGLVYLLFLPFLIVPASAFSLTHNTRIDSHTQSSKINITNLDRFSLLIQTWFLVRVRHDGMIIPNKITSVCI